MPLCPIGNADLFPFNTFAVHAKARQLFVIESLAALQEWHRQHFESSYVVIGGGSNIVLAGDIACPVLLNRIPGRLVETISEDDALVTGGAGENWHAFVLWTLEQGWYGLENLALIPGTVGASPIQNIGAYGVEICQRFHCLDAFDVETGNVVTLTNAQCHFGYRHSLFKEAEGERYIVLSVTFKLSRKPSLVLDYGDIRRVLAERRIDEPSPVDVCNAVQEIRRDKLPDPALQPNAGSFFKNPVMDAVQFERFISRHADAVHYRMPDGTHKLAAGWLIDQLGWKGKSIGPVTVNERQALVLINHGGNGQDILAAARIIVQSVKDHFGVTIEMEPRVLGG